MTLPSSRLPCRRRGFSMLPVYRLRTRGVGASGSGALTNEFPELGFAAVLLAQTGHEGVMSFDPGVLGKLTGQALAVPHVAYCVAVLVGAGAAEYAFYHQAIEQRRR